MFGEMMIRIKHLFFRYFTPVAVATALGVIAAVALREPAADWKFLVTVISVGLSLTYFIQKQKLDELHLFKDLFADFNERYDHLNEQLGSIVATSSGQALSQAERDTLVDYFNLCGEEYLYYHLGYVYPEVWQAWYKGMLFYYRNERIRTLWDQELSSNSYYGFRIRLTPTVGS